MEWWYILIIVWGLFVVWMIYEMKTAPLMPDNYNEDLRTAEIMEQTKKANKNFTGS